jgi:hypothetical protein
MTASRNKCFPFWRAGDYHLVNMTNRTISACAVACLLAGCAMALGEPKDDIVAAAKKLGDAPNYSWKQTVEGGPGASGEGKVQSDGLTYLSVTLRDNTMEIYFQGDKGAVKTDDGWQHLSSDAGGGGGGGGGFNPVMMASRMAKNLKTPAALAEDLAGKSTDLKNADGVYSGNLTDEAATGLLRMGRRRPAAAGAAGPQVSNAKATVKFWVADGMISKIQYHVTGTVSFNGNDRDVDRTSTVEIKDVGTTKIEVPGEAKAKWDEAASTEPAGNA